MKFKTLFLLFPLLFACNNDRNYIITVCPQGAPSLLFYDQGNNENFDNSKSSGQIIAQFQTDKCDAIIIDATNGLQQIKTYKETTPFRFKKLLTSGNLYLISYKNTALPNENSTLLSFGNENSVPRLVTNALNKTWNIKSNNLEYFDNVNLVLTKAKNDEKSYDYFLLAEPALSSLITTHNDFKGIWSYKELFNSEIPQAALFINKNKTSLFEPYMKELNIRIDNCINNPSIVKSKLDEYSKDDTKIFSRFGFPNSKLVYDIQNGTGSSKIKNGFAIYPSDKKYTFDDINKFLEKVGSTNRYDESYFIND